MTALPGMRSQHGEANTTEAAVEAAKEGIDEDDIGTLEAEEDPSSTGQVSTVKVEDEEAAHKKMEDLLKQKAVDGAVTMH